MSLSNLLRISLHITGYILISTSSNLTDDLFDQTNGSYDNSKLDLLVNKTTPLSLPVQDEQEITDSPFPPSLGVQYAEENLYFQLLRNRTQISRLIRPVVTYNEAITVILGATLQQIIDIDEINQLIELNVWLNFVWNDTSFAWVPNQYDNITSVNVPKDVLWIPDVLLYNSVNENFDSTYPTNVAINSDGKMEWLPPAIIRCTCKIDITWFPFDDQICEFKFGSWTYNGGLLDLMVGEVSKSTYTQNGEWELIGWSGKRTSVKYDCCPQPFVDVTFRLQVRRRILYYAINLIMPSVLITFMAILGFTLPPDSGEKIALGITIFMSLMVFLLVVAGAIPPTSETVPLIGVYFCTVLISVTLSVALTVLVLNFHHRSSESPAMGPILRKLFLDWLPRILMMDKHGDLTADLECKITSKDRNDSAQTRNEHGYPTEQLHLTVTPHPVQPPPPTSCPKHGAVGSPYIYLKSSSSFEPDISSQAALTSFADATPTESNGSVYGNMVQNCNQSLDHFLRLIYRELSVISRKVKEDDKSSSMLSEWKYAAMVLDRLLLMVIGCVLTVTTLAILLSAPHILE